MKEKVAVEGKRLTCLSLRTISDIGHNLCENCTGHSGNYKHIMIEIW